jgi:hypothetical protein
MGISTGHQGTSSTREAGSLRSKAAIGFDANTLKGRRPKATAQVDELW